jgi:hypothetical protein
VTTLLLVWHPALLGRLGPARPQLYDAESAGELQLVDAAGLPLEGAVAAALERLGRTPAARWQLLLAAPAAPFGDALPPGLAPLLAAPGLDRVTLLLLDGEPDPGSFGEVVARYSHLDAPAPPIRRVVRAPHLLERARSAPHELAFVLLYLTGDASNLPFESYLGSDGVRLSDDLAPLYARYRFGLERAQRELEASEVAVAAQLYDESVQQDADVTLPETAAELVPDHGAPRPEVPEGWIARRPRELDHDAWLLWRNGAESELLAHERAIEEREQLALAGGLEQLSELREARSRRPTGAPLGRDELREGRAEVDAALARLVEPTAPGGALTLAAWDRDGWRRIDRGFRLGLGRRPALAQLIVVPLLALVPLLLASATEREQGLPWLLILAGLGFVLALLVTVDALSRPLRAARAAVRSTVNARLEALRQHRLGGRRLIDAQLALWQQQQNGRVLDVAEVELRRRTRLHEYHEGQLRRHLSWQREIAATLPASGPPPPADPGGTDWRRDVIDLPLYRPSAYGAGAATAPSARCDESVLTLSLPRFAGLATIALTAARRG